MCQFSAIVESILGSSLSGPDLSSSVSDLSSLCGSSDWSSIQDVDFPSNIFSPMLFTPTTLNPFCLHPIIDAELLSSSKPHPGAWLQVVPYRVLLSLKYWLKVPLYSKDSACLICSTPADIFGDHQVSCEGNGDRIHRRDTLRDIIPAVVTSQWRI